MYDSRMNIFFYFLVPPVTGDGIKFKFVSEIFFLTQQCFHIGKSIKNYYNALLLFIL